jgi:hypothetical protein
MIGKEIARILIKDVLDKSRVWISASSYSRCSKTISRKK